MRRLSIALTTLFLMSPLASAATYTTPSSLMSAVENGEPRSFSLTAHTSSAQALYISIWAKGVTQGSDLMTKKSTSKATVDIVQGDMKVRLKIELLMTDGVLYAKVISIDGTMNNAFASLSSTFRQKVWLKIPLDSGIFSLLPHQEFFMSSSANSDVDDTFNLTSKTDKKGTTFTLMLKPDAANDLAIMLRELLDETGATSDDFFPWRELAQSMNFEKTVQLDTRGTFIGSSSSMSTKGASSSLLLTGTEKPTTAMKLAAPTDAIDLEQLTAMLMDLFPSQHGLPDDMGMMDEELMMDEEVEEEEEWSFDVFDVSDDWTRVYDPLCSDPEADSLQILMLQRTGSCPITKATTRYTR